MNTKQRLLAETLPGRGLLAVAGLAAAMTGAQARAETPEAQTQISEVVVTARKMEESLQRVPVAVSSISGRDIEKRSITNLSAVSFSTPNFTFSQQAQGGRSSNVVYIRGIGQSDTLSVYDPAVGIYLDGVYMGRMQANDLDMLDLQRVEVLRGPQGTLFGKNTSGGAINIVTAQPDASTEGPTGRVRVLGGSRNRLEAMADLNLPLVADKAALKIAGSVRKQDGYGRQANGEPTGDTNRYALRAQFLVALTEDVSALLSADYTNYREHNAVFRLVDVLTSVGPVAATNRLTSQRYDSRWLAPPNQNLSYATGPNRSDGKLWGAGLTLTLTRDWGTLKSITAYRHNVVDNDLDPDQSPVTLIDQFQHIRHHQVSQEFQATGRSLGDRLSWVGGLYYFKEGADDDTKYNLFTDLFRGKADFIQALNVDNESYAAYAQGVYNVTPQLRATLGGRYTVDNKDVTRAQLTLAGTPTQPTLTKGLTSRGFSPRFGLDYQWTPDVMTYVSVAQGYKAGGFSGRAQTVESFKEFKDERVWTYEAGLRSEFWDRRARLNLTGFYNDYSNMQIQINGSTLVNGIPTNFAIVDNIPKARTYGVEGELTLAPAAGLELSANAGLTEARYIRLPTDSQFIASSVVTTQTRFPNTPHLTVGASAEYTRELNDELTATGRVDYAYRTAAYYNFANTPLLRQGAYGLLNARITVESRTRGVSVAFFGTNLTNEHYILGGFDDAQSPHPGLGFAFENPGAPREWGVSAQIKF